MKKIIIALALMVGLTISVSAQKAIVKVPCKANKTVRIWNNKKAPHSNEELKDESRNGKGNFYNTSQTTLYIYKAKIGRAHV